MEARRPNDLEWSERVNGRESIFVLSPSRIQSIPLLVFASLWDSFFVMLWMGLSRAHAPQRAFLFPVAHGVVGVVVTWMALVRTLNVSRITLSPIELAITQSPIPRPATRIAAETVDHFDVHEYDGAKHPKRPWRRPRSVRAVLKSGQAVSLPFDLDGLDEVAFVAARLNAALATARGHRADEADHADRA